MVLWLHLGDISIFADVAIFKSSFFSSASFAVMTNYIITILIIIIIVVHHQEGNIFIAGISKMVMI